MAFWGKIFGGMAGFALGGPWGAMIGAAMGHAADQGDFSFTRSWGGMGSPLGGAPLHPARLAAMMGQREQLFALAVVTLSAKLAKCDGPVKRSEIDAFKRQFRIPLQQMNEIGRLFDQARDSGEDYAVYADELGHAFADNPALLEAVFASLTGIALADGPMTSPEQIFLFRVRQGFHLHPGAWQREPHHESRLRGGQEDPYAVLGVKHNANNDELRNAWRKLMRDNHPDSLASKGASAESIEAAHDKVARINAAWDQIKRERGL